MYAGSSKAFFYALSRSAALKRLASKYGMATPQSFARRFIAGETIEEAIECARKIQSDGLLLTLDYLGESVRTIEEAAAATREYIRLMDLIVAARHRAEHLAQAHAARRRRRPRHLRRQPAAHSRSRRASTASSSGSTWRTRRTRT